MKEMGLRCQSERSLSSLLLSHHHQQLDDSNTNHGICREKKLVQYSNQLTGAVQFRNVISQCIQKSHTEGSLLKVGML